MRIVIGVPTTGSIKTETVESLIGLIGASDYEIHFFTKTGCFIHDNRRLLVDEAKFINADYLLFIDSDIIVPTDTLTRLLAHNKMIIGVNSKKRFLPLTSTVRGEISEELFKCESVGTGCILINMKVFDIIDRPYFWYEDTSTQFISDFIGEDIWFCRQAERKGIEIWCDPTIKVGHIGDYIY